MPIFDLTMHGEQIHFGPVRSSWILPLLLASVTATHAVNSAPEKSVIQVYTFSQSAMWDAPWRFDSVRRGTGSGFVIKGKRIMTNAHVVSWARQILVRKFQDPRPYPAKIQFIGHDCDLAVLEVEDPSFYEGMEALEIGDMPKVRTSVVTYGYPAGGEQISYTRGVVSRIELQNYVHAGNRSFLTVQTDAAINPGNSGGPVIQDGQVVGVSFQGSPGLENTGFFIPPPVVNHFLKDIEDGTYHGFPVAGIRSLSFQNPAHRRSLLLPENGPGARIDSIISGSSAAAVLKEDDVILEINGFEVASDATILYDGNRLHMTAAMQTAQHGDKVPMKIWRDGKEITVNVPMAVSDFDKLVINQYDVPPRYFVYAGLVFTPLSLDYLKTFGRNWSDAANAELVYELYYRRYERPETKRPEPIVLATTLAHPVNSNLKITGRALINRINGKTITRLEDVINAIQSSTNQQHLIEFLPSNSIECLTKSVADQVNAEILKTYGISKDRRL